MRILPNVFVLDRNILVVSVRTVYGWKAYIGVVAGRSHDNEWPEVERTGTKVNEELARVMFPEMADVAYDY